MIAQMYVEWGSSSETFDFHRVVVLLSDREIKKVYTWLGWLRWWLAGDTDRIVIDYGYGYQARDRFNDAIKSRRINPDTLMIVK